MSYVIYASWHRPPDTHSRMYVPVFERADQARLWLTRFLADKHHFFEDDSTLILDTEEHCIRLRSSQWREIMAAPKANEPLRSDVENLILRFKYGTWDEVHVREVEDDGDTPSIERAPRHERAARVDKPDGYVTITELCNASGVLATHARAALRASGRTKPPYGWAFAANELTAIKKLIGIS